MSRRGGRGQLRRLGPLILLVTTVTVLPVTAAVLLAEGLGESASSFFSDMYELTGSRLTGLISFGGVVLLASTASICIFTARTTWAHPRSGRWSRFLLSAGLLTAVLAMDDYLSIHELADDILATATGVVAGRALKNGLEAVVLGAYGLLFFTLLWRFRSTVASSEWILLAIAGVVLLGSLTLDLAPHSWIADTLGLSFDTQALVEDTAKLTGIAFYATYFVRASGSTMRTMAG